MGLIHKANTNQIFNLEWPYQVTLIAHTEKVFYINQSAEWQLCMENALNDVL